MSSCDLAETTKVVLGKFNEAASDLDGWKSYWCGYYGIGYYGYVHRKSGFNITQRGTLDFKGINVEYPEGTVNELWKKLEDHNRCKELLAALAPKKPWWRIW